LEDSVNRLRFKRLGIHTQHEHFAYMRETEFLSKLNRTAIQF